MNNPTPVHVEHSTTDQEARLAATSPANCRVDISIVTFNAAAWLTGLIDSLRQQSLPTSCLRLLLRDNGSTDDSLALLHQLAGEHAEHFAAFEIEAGDNIGFGAGHNRNLRLAGADFFLVLNPDLALDESALETLITFAGNDDADTAAWELRQRPYEHPKHYDPVSLETSWCSGAAVMFRREPLQRLGGFDERFFLYGEDVDLSWRLRASGYQLRYLPWASCHHHSYLQPGQVKPAQARGAIFANVLLRLRFGTVLEILWSPFLLLAAIMRGGPGLKRRELLATTFSALRHTPHFLASRSKLRGDFQPLGLDYGWRRPGPFVPVPEAHEPAPLVSIVVRTTRGRGARLNEALMSLMHQTWARLEIVVVEDGSNESEALCRELDGQRGRRVAYVSIEAAGRCRAGNIGLSMCQGDLLGFLDDDDLLYADHIELLAGALAQKPGSVAAFSPAAEELIEIEDEQAWQIRIQRRQVPWQTGFSRTLLQYLNYLPIQSVLFRRELFERHGGLDEQLELLEDWDLWARFSLAGDFVAVGKLSSIFRTPANGRQRQQREKALRLAQRDIRRRNIQRCRAGGFEAIADRVEDLARGERSAWRVRPLIAGACRSLPGGLRAYEWLLRRRRSRLIALAGKQEPLS